MTSWRYLPAPCVRLVVASKFYLNLGGSHGITFYRSIYRSGINQGIFARRQDNQVVAEGLNVNCHTVKNWMKRKSAQVGTHYVPAKEKRPRD